jgi:hypothetical protein
MEDLLKITSKLLQVSAFAAVFQSSLSLQSGVLL